MNTPNDRFDNPPGQVPPSEDLHAGEYVLGVLDADARRQAQARMVADPEFARRVEDWEERFAPWLLQLEAIAPSPHVWPRIRTRLGWAAVESSPPGLWNSVGFWRGASALAAAAAVAAIAIGLRGPVTPTATPPVVVQTAPAGDESAARPVTVLTRDDGSPGWIASIDVSRGKVAMVPVPTPADASGLVHELWVIPQGQAPISLGFVSNEKAHTIDVPAALRRALGVGATLAITLEPQAGMPHSAPTGPTVAKGGISQI